MDKQTATALMRDVQKQAELHKEDGRVIHVCFMGENGVQAYKDAMLPINLDRQWTMPYSSDMDMAEVAAQLHKTLRSSSLGVWEVEKVRTFLVFGEISERVNVIAEMLKAFEKTVHVFVPPAMMVEDVDREILNTAMPEEITQAADLLNLHWYHLFDRKTNKYRGTHQVRVHGGYPVDDQSAPRYLTDNRLWANVDNDQVTDRYRIFGPVDIHALELHVVQGREILVGDTLAVDSVR